MKTKQHFRRGKHLLSIALAILLFSSTGMRAETSRLWGTSGETWKPNSRLPYFGFAGYRCGNDAIQDIPVVTLAEQFGVIPDDGLGDSAAIQAAIDATDKGAILLPAGRLILDHPIVIRKSAVVLRGAGAQKTILYVPRSLQDLYPLEANADHGEKLKYSFRGSFLSIKGTQRRKRGSAITHFSARGETRLRLASTTGFERGDWIELSLRITPDFGKHLHADLAEVGEGTRNLPFSTVARITSVRKNYIIIDRPLRFDVRPEWKPTLSVFHPTLRESGFEDFTIQMAGHQKKAHLLEEGFNAIELITAVNCWVRQVEIIDADIGIKIDQRSRFCQLERLLIRTEQRKLKDGPTGHHAIWISGGSQECLVSDFKIETEYIHDLSVEGLANGNVIRRGSGDNLNFDHHRNAPFENLFSDIDAGVGTRLWKSSGSPHRGPHSGARSTAWNIRHSATSPPAPKRGHFPQLNLIGVQGASKKNNADDWWVEVLNEPINPPELYESQVRWRNRR